MLSLAVLASEPSDAPRTPPKLTVRLSIGGFLGSVMVSQSFRGLVDRMKGDAANDFVNHGSLFDSPQYLWQAAPVLGPWMVAAQGGYQAQQDMGLLIVSGLLQAVGLSTLTYRLVTERPAQIEKPKVEEGLSLDVSPVVSNRLGLMLTLTGW
jgi:hypothetical protein